MTHLIGIYYSQGYWVKGKALKSLYVSVQSSIRANYLQTEWFDVKYGLRQGCTLSTRDNIN